MKPSQDTAMCKDLYSLAPWVARMNNISSESPHWGWLVEFLIKSVVAVLSLVMVGQSTPILLHRNVNKCEHSQIAVYNSLSKIWNPYLKFHYEIDSIPFRLMRIIFLNNLKGKH